MAFVRLRNVTVEFAPLEHEDLSFKRALLRGFRPSASRYAGRKSVKALENVDLTLEAGDRIALIGLNGSGKTTLLRTIAGIYAPRHGSVMVEGSVTPLIDTALGIDPEATGLENVMLRGFYLGHTRAEIRSRVEDIEEFCDLGDYFHRPLKTYSAGMVSRLLFAISTAFKPDILLLDEAIGAGDVAFAVKAQQRAAAFLDQASILVMASHSEELLRMHCTHAVAIDHGRIVGVGRLEDELNAYHRRVGVAGVEFETLTGYGREPEECAYL